MRASVLRASIAVGMIAGLLAPYHLSAQPAPDSFAAIRKQAQSWNDQPSPDTAPIDFTIGEVHYTVPRNYIVWMDNWNGGPQTLVRFKVTFPGLEPLTAKNNTCMTAAPLIGSPECTPVEFWVRRSGGDVSDDEGFANVRSLFHSQTPLSGPDGFELYETGPADARINTYRKKVSGHTLVIACFLGQPRELRKAVCENHSLLPNGDVLAYRLYGSQLELAGQIDAGFRRLTHSFTSSGR